jgi:hypothetical protein
VIPSLQEAAAGVAAISAHELLWVLLGTYLAVGAAVGGLVARAAVLLKRGKASFTDLSLSRPPVPAPRPRLTDEMVNERMPELEALYAEADR